MNNKNKVFKTYKFYDKNGRRLSIFGEEEGDTIAITVFTCNKDDRFEKSKAVEHYNKRDIKSFNYNIPLESEYYKDNVGKLFLEWCRNKYRQKVTKIKHVEMLIKSN